MTALLPEGENGDAPTNFVNVALDEGHLIRRVDSVAHHGELGDQTLWAPGHRPVHARGADSVMWELLAEPGTLDEIVGTIADEYRIERTTALPSARDSVLRLWSSGALEIDGTSWPKPSNTATLPPNP